jgi:hypothetical protein
MQEERNLELVNTIQEAKEEIDLQHQNHEIHLEKYKEQHLKVRNGKNKTH